MASVSKTTKVHALLVGINDYQENLNLNPGNFPRLFGCVHDAEQMLHYLQKDPTIELTSKSLFDKTATKLNILKAFEQDLSKATAADTVLFYFSGHGTVEEADTAVWQEETDGRLEAIVCYYEDTYAPDFLLTDKELRYLLGKLHQKTGAHIVTIFDCCNSGDNTRSAAKPEIRQKRIDFVFPKRKWEDFIFSAGYKGATGGFEVAEFANQLSDNILPQGAHVQMSAAESDEVALESGGQGVFTTYLLHTLRQSGGNLSYRELHSRISNKLRGVYEQQPKLYTPNQHHHLLQSGFLNKEVKAVQDGTIVFNSNEGQNGQWILDRGVMHGVQPGKTTLEVELANKGSLKGTVISANLDTAIVHFEAEEQLGRQDHRVEIAGIKQAAVQLRLVNKNALDGEVEALLDQMSGLENENMLVFTDNADVAEFDLVLANDLAYLTLPGDEFRPLLEPLFIDEENTLKTLEHNLTHIAQWSYLKQLENNGKNKIPDNYLQADFSLVGSDGIETPLHPDSEKAVDLKLQSNDDGTDWGKLKITLTNNSPGNLYVAGMYLEMNFSVQAGLFEPKVTMIEPGRSVAIFEEHGGIPLVFDPKWYWYNLQQEKAYLNFVYSTTLFAEDQLEKPGLLTPIHPQSPDRGGDQTRGNKGLGLQQKAPTVLEGWNSQSYQLVFHNPTFDQHNDKKLEGLSKLNEMLLTQGKSSYLGHFAAGLYLQQVGFGGQQKPSALEGAVGKSFFWTAGLAIANRYAHFWRNRRYKKMVKQLPDTPRLLAEGDSWFQHPLLTDIIDNVGRFYPVYCLSAAGDTIRNYPKSGTFIAEINEQDPAVFLLSGGGNDILGENMRNFLAAAEDRPEAPQPKDFFTPQLINELNNLGEIYRTIFDYFRVQKPELHIVVHGYDYPRPLAADASKMSWIGKYLDEKDITEDTDRQAVVNYLMDTFNTHLSEIVDEFDKVHYLDLRGTANDHQWDDEIHPDNVGFQNISLKFVQMVNSIVQ